MNRMTSLLLTYLIEQAIMTFIYLFMNLYGGWLIWTNTLLNFLFLILNILLHTGKNNSTRVFLHVIIGFLSYPQCQKVRSYLSASSSNWWMFWQLLVANLFWIMIGLGCGYWRTTKMGSGGWELFFFFPLKWKTVHILQAASTQARRCFHKTLFVKESSICASFWHE